MSDQEIFELHKTDFIECDTCRPKPGSPVLCRGCLHNRKLIMDQQQQIKELEQEVERLKDNMEHYKLLYQEERERPGLMEGFER